MKKSVKIVSLILCAVFAALSFGSCGSVKEKNGVSVVTTIFPQYDFAKQVLGERGEVTLLIPPGKEAHSYEPTVADIAAIRRADIFIYVGGSTDGWVSSVLEGLYGSGVRTISLLSVCGALREETVEGMETEEHDHEGGEHVDEVEYDEHVWTSPVNAIKITEAITDALCEIDPEGREEYTAACDKYTEKLTTLDAAFRKTVGEAKGRTIVFAERFPFRYLCSEYGIEYYAAFPGCSSQSEPSLATVAFLVNKIKENKLSTVLTIEFSTGTVANWIAEKTGTKVAKLHSCHNLTAEEIKNGETYISLMEKNLEVLKEALN